MLHCLVGVNREEFETLGLEMTSKVSEAEGKDDSEAKGADDERPVQGPINREPYEKLYPGRKESGIRKM